MLSSFKRPLATLLLLAAAMASSFAQAPNVTAVLTESETAVGQPVQFEIHVTGVSNPKPPGEIVVDGLEIRSAGVSRQYQMQNFSVSYSFTYNYNIMPLKPGTFRIPPQVIEAGGKSFRTPELTLNVVDSPAQSGRGGRGRGGGSGGGAIDASQIGFVEMLLPKSVAYVGEMVPVQVRVGLNMRTPIESLQSGLQIAGQGFTMLKLPEPRQTVETVNGRNYQAFIFKTAIAAARAGKLDIGPAEISPIVRVPRGGGARNPMLPRDLADDPFFNQFFNDPGFAPSVAKEVKLKADPQTIEVKPLPQGAPPEFSGAVGNFVMKVEASPKTAQVGDPVTITATITGRGNFDRVNAPVLSDEKGWHKYPPSDSFKQDDDVGISGAKTFETVVSANERKDKLPPLVFTYFDPVKESYVTLKSDAIPLRIEGGAAPTATPPPAAAAAAAPSVAPSVAPAPVPAKQPDDILAQLDDRRVPIESFKPLYARSSFWAAQLVPLLVLLGFIGWMIRQARRGDRAAQRLAGLQHEAAELQRKLRANGATPQEYVSDASRAVQLKTALARNVDPDSVDAETASDAFRLDQSQRARLRQLFAESDELRYSGGNGNGTLSPDKRQQILELVEELRA